MSVANTAPGAFGTIKMSRCERLSLMLRMASRELRSGIGGFYVFILCIALGVAVIATVGSLADALRNSFERQGASILGGDVTMARPHTRASGTERAWIEALGPASEVATVRAMARRIDGEEQALIEIKGIDERYPLVGTLRLSGGVSVEQMRRSGDIAVEPILLERLGVKIGEKIQLGKSTHT
ncbi:MAG: ABC transporter permease, partial [Hyphomicrobiaceae bacterium]